MGFFRCYASLVVHVSYFLVLTPSPLMEQSPFPDIIDYFGGEILSTKSGCKGINCLRCDSSVSSEGTAGSLCETLSANNNVHKDYRSPHYPLLWVSTEVVWSIGIFHGKGC